MALSIAVCQLRQLKDQRVDIHERLKLAQALWNTEDDLALNKQQVIVDCVVSMLLNCKKSRHKDMDEAVEREAWKTLCLLLKSVAAKVNSQQALDVKWKSISLRASIACVLVESMENKVVSCLLDDELKMILDCCGSIMCCTGMAEIIDSRINLLVQLCSVLCHLSLKVCQDQAWLADLEPLLSQVSDCLWKNYHRGHLNILQVLQQVTERLLQPVLKLNYCCKQLDVSTLFKETIAKLQEFVIVIFLHRDQQKLFKTLSNGTSHCDTAQEHSLPFLSELKKMFKQSMDESNAQESDKQVVLNFLPKLFEETLKVWKEKKDLCFVMLKQLHELLGADIERCKIAKYIVSQESVGAIASLLLVMRKSNIYSVAADRASGSTQLAYFTSLLSLLLHSPVTAELCGCVEELLELNHHAVESCFLSVLSCLSAALTEPCEERVKSGVDRVVSCLMIKYHQLHQLPQFYHYLINLSSHTPQLLLNIMALPGFSHSVSIILSTLTPTVSREIWRKIQSHIISITQSLLHQPLAESDLRDRQLWSGSVLLYNFISSCGGSSETRTASSGGRVELVSQLEHDLLGPLMQQTSHCQSLYIRRAFLLLAVSLGQEKLCLYIGKSATKGLPDYQVLPFSIRDQLKKKLKKHSASDYVLRFLLDLLFSQSLEMSLLEQETVDLSPLLLGFEDSISRIRMTSVFNGLVWNVKEDTYPLCRLWLLARQEWIPLLIENYSEELAQIILHVVLQEASVDVAVERPGWGVQHLLNLATHSSRGVLLHQHVVCAWWQQWAVTLSFQPALQTVCQQLAVPKRDLSHVANSVQKLVMSIVTDGSQIVFTKTQTSLLQFLSKLPLTHLRAESKVQCGLGLLMLLHIITRDSLHKAATDKNGGPALLCQMLVQLLDASVGTSLLSLITPAVLLQCLMSLAIEAKVQDHSPVGSIVRKAVAMVMRDFESVLHIEDFIHIMSKRVTEVGQQVLDGSVLWQHPNTLWTLTMTHYILVNSYSHLRKDFYRGDVQKACREHFTLLSEAVVGVVDAIQKKDHTASLPPVLLLCLSDVMHQYCLDAQQSDTKCLSARQLCMIQFALQALPIAQHEGQMLSCGESSEKLQFICCIYQHHKLLNSILHSYTDALWMYLLFLLTDTCIITIDTCTIKTDTCAITTKNQPLTGAGPLQQCIVSGVKRVCESADTPAHKRQKLMSPGNVEAGKLPTSCALVKDKFTGAVVKDQVTAVDAAFMLLSSSTPPVFTHFLQQLLQLLDRGVCGTLGLWQRVVECETLNDDCRKALELLAPQMLEQCLSVMEKSQKAPVCQKLLSILHCLSSMLSTHQLLSSRGCSQSLLCAWLVPLQVLSDEDWILVFPATCQLVHAVLLHHPHTALKLSDTCLALVSSLMKQSVNRGEQKKLLNNHCFVKPMSDCAESVSRLLMLMASHEKEVQRVMATIISDYTNAVKSLTLHPAVKKCLLMGVYACLDKCDRHAIEQLRQRLTPGMKQVFHMLYTDFDSYYRYSSKD